MRILVIEDDAKIAGLLKKGLSENSYAVDCAYDGKDGYDLAASEPYDVIVLDAMLPGMDGFSICRALRKESIHTPILMLTARGELEDKIAGLDAGADDYLAKPFAFSELTARIRALVRRPQKTIPDILEIDGVRVDSTSHTVSRHGVPVTLSKKEFALLVYLMKNSPATVSKEQIIQNVWSFDDDVLPNTVEVYIGYVRNKIEKPFSQKPLIHTIRGFGYSFYEKK